MLPCETFNEIIESHFDPDCAISDAKQQITPEALATLLSGLKMRDVNTTNQEFIHTLETLREKIDQHDDDLLDILQQRMTVAETIGMYKKQNDVTILQPARWDEIITKTRDKGEERKLSNRFIDKLFKAIHEESIDKQMKIMNNGVATYGNSNE